jgi:hypothetical protein
MSTERGFVVGVDDTRENQVLVAEIISAAARARKADPGDRVDIVRFEALSSRLEQAALREPRSSFVEVSLPTPGSDSILAGADRTNWSDGLGPAVLDAASVVVATGRLPVLVVEPLRGGQTTESEAVALDEPATRWDSGGEHGRRAVEARFRAQIVDSLHGETRTRRVISPSGIQNPVVTEILREFVQEVDGEPPVNVDVEYRDGSRSAHRFALRAVNLRSNLLAASLELKFALLSIRHAEMDAVIHGAWLRNAEVSRPRPAAQTDDLVYEISRKQLDELCQGESHVRLYMYQTGLETAVVGFYKALTDHLVAHPRSVSVQPMFFDGAPRTPQRDANGGQNRAKSNGSKASAAEPSVVTESAMFRKGTPWTM